MGRERQSLRGTKEEGRERGSSGGGAPPRPVHLATVSWGPIFLVSTGHTAVPEGLWNMWVPGTQWGVPRRCPWFRQVAQGLPMDFHSLGSWDLGAVSAEANLTDTLTSLATGSAPCILWSSALHPPLEPACSVFLPLCLFVSVSASLGVFFSSESLPSLSCVSLSLGLSPTPF